MITLNALCDRRKPRIIRPRGIVRTNVAWVVLKKGIDGGRPLLPVWVIGSVQWEKLGVDVIYSKALEHHSGSTNVLKRGVDLSSNLLCCKHKIDEHFVRKRKGV